VQHDQLQRILIPGADKGEDGQSADAGLDDRHDDLPERPQFAGAVNARRFQQRGRNRLRELLHQEDAERPAGDRQDHRPQGFGHAQVLRQRDQRNQDDLLGQRHGADEQREDEAFAPERLLRQRIAGQRRREAGDQHRHQRDQHAVDQPADCRRHLDCRSEQHHGHLVLHQGLVVGHGRRKRQPLHTLAGLNQNVRFVLDGSRDDPVQREDEQQRQDDQQNQAERFITGFLLFHRAHLTPWSRRSSP